MTVSVCVITSVHPPFDGRIFHRQCRALTDAGFRVTLVAPSDSADQTQHNVRVIGVPLVKRRWQRPLTWWWLLLWIVRLRPQIVHLHDPELLLLIPLLRILFRKNIRVIYDVHEYYADAVRGKYWIPSLLRHPLAAIVSGAERLAARLTDGIILAVSGQRPLFSNFRGPIAVVRNLPFSALFANPSPSPALAAQGLKLIFVGLILPKRGIHIVVEAMARLQDQGITDVELYLIGAEVSADYTASIKAYVDEHGLTNRVHWLGYIPHHQLADYLTAADVGLAPGLYTQQYKNPTLATKLFEYMLCGLPVIGTDYPHYRAYIEQCDCGRVAPAEDISAYAEAIRWMRDHPQQADAMGQRGREMVLAKYTWELEQSRLLRFYNRIAL